MAYTARTDGKVKSRRASFRTSLLPALFIATTILQLALFEWPKRWLISGAPALTFVILQGEANGKRVLPFAHVWPLFTTLNLAYAIASTSWLLYWVFTALCYPAIFVTCIFQFRIIGALTRQTMRAFIKQLHFTDDKIALFDLPALEIDTDVDGLMVLRGITFSLSTLSFTVHGVEVGIKLSDDLEVAIQTESVTVSLFRGIDIGDCFANLKGGQYEMTFGNIAKKSKDEDGDALLATDSPILKAASGSQSELVKMKCEMTDGSPPQDSSPISAMEGMRRQSIHNNSAGGKYRQMLDFIDDTSAIRQSRKHVEHIGARSEDATKAVDPTDEHALRAAICAQLHSQPSVPHPPRRSIKVTTLRDLSSPRVKRFMHRLPMLLRLLLNPLSYFHPVKISSITATASGRWIEATLIQRIFKEYGDASSELQHLQSRVSAWVSDASFAVELGTVVGYAHVPFIPFYNINCRLAFEDVVAYRALPEEVSLSQVMRLGGADATFVVPTFLLPHHEHLVPEVPKRETRLVPEEAGEDADGKPRESLNQAEKDEAAVGMSVRARLPATFDQELLDFITVLVKASKLVEIEQSPSPMDEDVHNVGQFTEALNQKLKGGLKKALIAKDQWLAKLVGKGMRKLEEANGDLGYSGDIPVKLGPYRETGWLEIEGEKLLV